MLLILLYKRKTFDKISGSGLCHLTLLLFVYNAALIEGRSQQLISPSKLGKRVYKKRNLCKGDGISEGEIPNLADLH